LIRVVTLDEYEPVFLKEFCKILYTAFGVGSEHVGLATVPHGQAEPYDSGKLLEAMPKVMAFADDKVLFLTARKLAARKLATGEAPTYGWSQYNGQRAVVSSAHVKSPAENVRVVARYAMQEVGHTLGLHHCLDPRCAMYPQWTPSYPEGDSIFCTYCREQSELKLRQAKS
jgi:predicted Zn-dependent protease